MLCENLRKNMFVSSVMFGPAFRKITLFMAKPVRVVVGQGENVNRLGEGASARDVDSAIAALSVSGQPEVDAHPER